MLRITPTTNAAQAKTYYTTADYYLGENERPGTWHGKAADRLGLSGRVQREQWDALCDNHFPCTGERLTPRSHKDRRIGYDCTFDVPKSVSLLYAMTKDERLIDAFRQSVDDTMADIQREMKTRVRRHGADTDRVTGEAVWGTFIHFTTRPENGLPDPHMHAHCFVFNNTFDTDENRWKAGQFGDLKRDAPYFEGLYQVRLAERLAELGLPIERTKTGYEIAGVSRATVRKFSRRTERIERLALEKGITDPKEKGALGAKTRNRKVGHQTFDQLCDTWRSWLTPDESRAMLIARHRLEAGINEFKDDPQLVKEALESALSHHFERASVVPERTLLATALKRSAGRASVATVMDQYARAGVIVGERDGRRMVTTREVLQEERRVIAFAREGRGTSRPLGDSARTLVDPRLSESQRNAVGRMLASPDRVILLRGAAGVGKTTIMKETIAGIEEGGHRVFTFAPSADAGRGVLREEVSEQANTVAYLLKNERLHPELEGQVIWIDEAGLVGTKTLREVFDLAGRLHARVILSGDRRQHGSVERGATLRLLETEAGLVPAELSEIRRQSGAYREAVQALADGRTEDGFHQIQALGWVHELPEEMRYTRLACDYADALQTLKPGQRILAVAPTHKEGEAVTAAIRSALKESGRLSSKERTFPTLNKTNFTAAERADPLIYGDGDMVVFHQNAKGHTKGQRLAVAADATNIPLDQASRFQVFHTGSIALAAGDDIRITNGGESLDGHRLNNGATYTVESFTSKGDIKLTNGWVVGKDFGHLTYGWVRTSHSSQGKSVDRVFIAQSADSYPASSAPQWYVSVSRGKHRADIYCEDAKELLEAVRRSDERLSATELIHHAAPHHAHQRSLQPVRSTAPTAHRPHGPRRDRELDREEVAQ